MNFEQFLDICSINADVLVYVLDNNTAKTICKLNLVGVDVIALRDNFPHLMSYRVGSVTAVDGIIHADICKED